jgi:hypothetical protein
MPPGEALIRRDGLRLLTLLEALVRVGPTFFRTASCRRASACGSQDPPAGAAPSNALDADPTSRLQHAIELAAAQRVDRPLAVQQIIGTREEVQHRPGACIAQGLLDGLEAAYD